MKLKIRQSVRMLAVVVWTALFMCFAGMAHSQDIDSLLSMDSAMSVNELQLLFENQNKQTQIEKLQLERARNNRLFHTALIIILTLSLVLLYVRFLKLKNARNLLSASERKFRMLAENSAEVIWSCDLDLNLTYISPSTEQLFGYPRDERMKKTMEDVFGKESVDFMKRALDKNLESVRKAKSHDALNIELKGFHKNGSEVFNCGKVPCSNCMWSQVLETGKTIIRNFSPDDPVYRSGNYRIY